MTDRLTPQREAEIAARATSEHLTPGPWELDYESCDCGGDYPCGHGLYVTGVVTPEPTWSAAERLKRTGEEPRDYDFHRGEIGDFSEADWALMASAREDVPALLAELAAVRAERDEAREDLDFLHRTTLPELRRTVQHHEDGKKRWRDRAREAEAMVSELKRPAELKRRNEVRSTYSELISQAEQDRDHEGAAGLAQLLDDAEAKWQREDEEAAR